MVSKKKLKQEIAVLKTQLRVKEIHEENAQRETRYAERRCSELRVQLAKATEEKSMVPPFPYIVGSTFSIFATDTDTEDGTKTEWDLGPQRIMEIPEPMTISYKNIFENAYDVPQLLGQLIGYASRCWNTEDDGERVFDTPAANFGLSNAQARLSEILQWKDVS